MNRRTVFLSLLGFFVVAAALAAAAFAPSTLAFVSGNRPSANGQGSLTVLGENRTFAFTAHTRKDGSVAGNVLLQSRHADTVFHADIDCINVVGNTATLSGIILNSSDPFFIGFRGIFRIQDNGEGSYAAPDALSFYFPTPAASPVDCTNAPPFPLIPIEHGNIQLRP